MLEYVMGQTAHKTQNTISINDSRRLIINLAEPLARVAKNYDDNLRIIATKQSQLADNTKTINELKQQLHLDLVRINVIEIDHPKTVCTHTDCTDVHIIEGAKDIHYKQLCHKRCYLKRVPKEVRGSPELRFCTAMDRNQEDSTCRHCEHSFSVHMHIYYDTKPYQTREIDKKVDADIKKEEEVREVIAVMIEELNRRKNSLEEEKDIVQMSMAKFAHFLSDNAITPYNDTYQEYIRYLIENEKRRANSDANLIRSYETMINVHKEQTNILDQQLEQAKKKDSTAKVITAEDVVKLVQDLYQLEFSGKTIREFYERQQKVRRNETMLHTEKNVDASRWVNRMNKRYKKRTRKSKKY